jgi:hypothetical protein
VSLGLLVGFLIIVACFAWALMPLFAARQPRQRTEAESAPRSM